MSIPAATDDLRVEHAPEPDAPKDAVVDAAAVQGSGLVPAVMCLPSNLGRSPAAPTFTVTGDGTSSRRRVDFELSQPSPLGLESGASSFILSVTPSATVAKARALPRRLSSSFNLSDTFEI